MDVGTNKRNTWINGPNCFASYQAYFTWASTHLSKYPMYLHGYGFFPVAA